MDTSIVLHMSMPFETEQPEKEFAVIVMTEDGTIVDAHDGCKESLGWSRENLAGQDIGALIPAHRGLLLSGILQSCDSESQLGEETTFSMRILAQRMDETSFPARLVVRRFGESDCWAATFYHTAPLTPPDPHAPLPQLSASGAEQFSIMQCTPLEETPQPEACEPAPSADPCDSADAPVDSAEIPTDFTDEALEQPLFLKAPASLPAEEPETESDQSSILDIQSIPEPALAKPSKKKNTALLKQTKSVSPAIKETGHQSEERHLLEQRVASLTSQLTSVQSELRQHLEVQTRTEKKLGTFEEQLSETRKSLARATADLARRRTDSSGELESTRTLNKALEEHLALHKSANQALQRTSAEVERQLAALNSELSQTRAALAQETAKRHDLERKLTALDQDRSAQERKAKLEICRLEAALKAKELELKQLELTRSEESEDS